MKNIIKTINAIIVVAIGVLSFGSVALADYSTTTTYTASGIFTVHDGVTSITVQTVGAGGGGAGGAYTYGGGGGGAGEVTTATISVTPGQEIQYTIGTGGTSGTAGSFTMSAGNGGNGSATSFGTFVTANGGFGGEGAEYRIINGIGGFAGGIGGTAGIDGARNNDSSITLGGNGGNTTVGVAGLGSIGTPTSYAPATVGTNGAGGGAGSGWPTGDTGAVGGNGSITVSYTIDETAPVITVLSYATSITNLNVAVTATTNEGTIISTSTSASVINAGAITTVTFSVNGSVTFVARDLAGNVSSITITISNIDKVAPIITVLPYATSSTNLNIAVTAVTNEGTITGTSTVAGILNSISISTATFTDNGTVTFTATDAAGNVFSTTTTITNIDRIAPVIILLGTNPVNVGINTVYTDAGATAFDLIDGVIIATTTSNNVNKSATGTYLVTYSATDSAGNTATSSRTINVTLSTPVIISFIATPASISSGQTSVLSWTVTNLVFCKLSGPNGYSHKYLYASNNISDSTSTPLLTNSGNNTISLTYVLNCTNFYGTTTETLTINVSSTPAALTSISIAPLTPTLSVGSTTTFIASTTDQNGADIFATTTWETSSSSVGTIDSSGMFTAISVGTTTVSASAGVISTSTVVTVSTTSTSTSTSTSIVNLGTSANYVILAKTAITATGVTSITGDIGISPAFSTDITGFGLVLDSSGTFSTSSLVIGKIYAADYSSSTSANLTLAVSAMEAAYTDGNSRATDVLDTGACITGTCDLAGLSLVGGVYTFTTPGNVTITNDITLSGSASDVWIFQIPGNLDISGSKKIILSGGAQASNIFWVVAGTTTLEPGSTFEGNILGGPGASTIAMQNGAILNGRALGQTDVTLIGNTISTSTISTNTFVLSLISILPLNLNTNIGATTTFTSTTLDQFGNSFATTTTWETSSSSVGTIDSSGMFTAVSVGTTTITATAGALSTSTVVTVSATSTVDLVSLNAEIIAAQNELASTTANNTSGQYSASSTVALQAAIDNALLITSTSTQAQIDAALSYLNTAVLFNGIYTNAIDNGIDTNIYDCDITPTACVGLYFTDELPDTTIAGKITFLSTLDLTGTSTITFLQNISTHLAMSLASISFDAGTSVFNSPAHLEMYQIPVPLTIDDFLVFDINGNLINPNGISNFIYNAGTQTVSFDVAHFTIFTAILAVTIETATNLLNTTPVGIQIGDVSQSTHDIYNTAIDVAIAVNNSTTTTQVEADNAKTNLDLATTVFNSEIITAGPNDSTVTATASYDKHVDTTLDIVMTLNGTSTLTSIANGVTILASSTDYNVSGSTVTLAQAYMQSQSVGATTLTFTFSAGANDTTVIAVTDSTPATTTSVLTSISISPLNPSITATSTQQFTATILDQNGIEVSTTTKWYSSNQYVGTIDAVSGMFTAVSAGQSVVSASAGPLSTSTLITVTVATTTPVAPALYSISISTLTPSVTVGGATAQFISVTLDQYNAIFATTTDWTTSDPSIGTIDSSGVFTGVSAGTVTVTGTAGTLPPDSMVVTVFATAPTDPSALYSISISTLTPSVTVGGATAQFISVTLDQYNAIFATTTDWTTSDPSIGTIDSSGVFTGVSAGTVTVTGTAGTLPPDSMVVTVNPAVVIPSTSTLSSISISPLNPSITATSTQQFTAIILDQNGIEVSTTTKWYSSNSIVGTIDINGMFTAVSAGQSVVSASAGPLSTSTLITVTAIVATTTLSDLTAYSAALNAVVQANFTPASWTAYQIVVLANVMTTSNTQAEVDAATANISAAQVNLVLVVVTPPVTYPSVGGGADSQTTPTSDTIAPVTTTSSSNSSDTVAPIITLIGSNPMSLSVGETYTEAGATAYDNINGDLTSRINIVSSVNTNIAGSYPVVYTAKDNAGNTGSITRTVIVNPVVLTSPVIIHVVTNSTGSTNGTPDSGIQIPSGVGELNPINVGEVSTTTSTSSNATTTASISLGLFAAVAEGFSSIPNKPLISLILLAVVAMIGLVFYNRSKKNTPNNTNTPDNLPTGNTPDMF